MFGNFGGGELVVIVLVALIFLGPDRIPDMARGAGRLLHRLKTMTEGMQGQMSDVLDDPAMKPLRELGEFAARPRQKLTQYALEAEAEARAKKEQEAQDSADAVVEAQASSEPVADLAATDDTITDDTGTDDTIADDTVVDAGAVRAAEAKLKSLAARSTSESPSSPTDGPQPPLGT